VCVKALLVPAPVRERLGEPVFWIGQLAAMTAILSLMLRGGR
jgi:hypothetical protein